MEASSLGRRPHRLCIRVRTPISTPARAGVLAVDLMVGLKRRRARGDHLTRQEGALLNARRRHH